MTEENQIHKETLKNGLEVMIEPRPNRKVTGIEIMIKTGANHQNKENRGIMHLIEHLLGNGSDMYPEKGKAMKEISKLGGTLDMGTGRADITISGLISSEHQDKLLELIIDMAFRSNLSHVEKEKRIIKNEIEESEDDEEDRADKKLRKAMYKNSYLLDILGSIESIDKIKKEEIKTTYQEVIHPNNASIAIIGPINKQKTLNNLEKYTSNLEKRKEPKKEEIKTLNKVKQIREDEERCQTYMKMATHLSPEQKYSKTHFKKIIIKNILGLTPDLNLLYNNLREKNQLVYDVLAYEIDTPNHSKLLIETSFNPKNEKKVRNIIDRTIKELPEQINEKDLDDFKSHIKGYNRIEEDDPNEKTWLLNKYNQHNSLDLLKKRNKKIEQVTLDEIKEFSKKHLKPDEFFTYLLEPEQN